MDDLYDDLENYDDVDTDQLKSSNSELKYLLDERNKTIEKLQKDFDKLAAEYKLLETNYSSLLKSARAEVQRKTDMITKLNIEKDTLILTAAQKLPHNEIQKLLNNVKTEAKRKKKKKREIAGECSNDRTEFIRRESKRPPSPEGSSTATDNSNKMVGDERVVDTAKTSIRVTQENEGHKREVFPGQIGDGNRSPVAVDRRVSALARHQFSKLSSDEEFEDMYSALKPEKSLREPERTLREPERNRKRGRDNSEHSKTFHNNTHDRPSNYPDPFRERFNRNITGRFSSNDRNKNRDKKHNESDRHMNRDKQYDSNKSDKYDSHYQRDSPERHRRGAKELSDDCYTQQYDRNRRLASPPRETKHMNRDKQYDSNKSDKYDSHYQRDSPERHRRGAKELSDDFYTQQYDRNRRLASPPRETNQHRSRERRRSCHDRERDDLLASPPREKNQHKSRERRRSCHDRERDDLLASPPRETNQHRSRERRRSCHDRERDDLKQDALRYNQPEIHMVRHHIHGEYEEPQNKRPRIDPPYTIPRKDRKLSEKQYSKEMYLSNPREHTCQSPDFSHEESCNEHILEIKSTASTVLEDPRVTSKKYVKSSEGEKEVLQSVNANKIHMQPVNKSLWSLQEVQAPNALRFRPSEISEEPVDEMDIDKPLSIISMESGEIGSETTDTVIDDVSDFQERNKSNYKYGSCKTNSQKIEKEHRIEKSPIENIPEDIQNKRDILDKHQKEKYPIDKENSYKGELEKSPLDKTSKHIGHKSDIMVEEPKTRSKLLKSEKANNLKSDKPTTMTDNKVDTNTHSHTTQIPSILHRLIHSIDDSTERDNSDKSLRNKEGKEYKTSINSRHKNYVLEKEPKTRFKLIRPEKANKRKPDEPTTVHPRDNKIATNTHGDTTEKSSMLHQLLQSIDKGPGRDYSDKSRRSEEEKEHKETLESKRSDKAEQDTSRTKEQKEHKISSDPEKGNESSVPIVREFEHRVYSTRHIVEGDLELSDESNDETQLKIDEKKIDTKVKQKVQRKSTRDICKEKPVDLEETTRKTRSKKDTGKSTNKFSELFGDSSSLITPEDLSLATRVAHALPAECFPPALEDAQDGIIESQQSVQTLTSKVTHSISETKGNSDGPTIEEDKNKGKITKDSKNRTHKRHKNSESALVSDDAYKASGRQELSEVKKKIVNSTETPAVTEVKLVLPNEKLKKIQNAKITTDTIKNDALKPNEKDKGSIKSNKRLKNKDQKRLPISKPAEESNTVKTYDILEANSNKILVSDNKENTSCNDESEGNISSEMARIFENTPVSDVSKVNTEQLPLHHTAKDTVSDTGVEDVPNLAPVIDEPGLVKTVVISTGIQLLDPNPTQCTTAFKALASSTPARELPVVNHSTEMEPKISHSAHVSVTIERDDTVSQSENDAPDIRINYYRRRRKVLKR